MRTGRTSINVFLSHAHKDEKLKNKLIEHMSVFKRQGLITILGEYSNGITQQQTYEYLDSSDLILLLVSPAYIASDYCYEIEMHRAMERHSAGEARVIPIILSPCRWQGTPLGKLLALPKHFKPVTQWNNREEAFDHIVKNIRTVLDELKQGSYGFTGATTTSTTPLSELSPYTLLSVYMSYVWEDEPVEQELEAHLQMLQRQALINIWHPDMISAGREWASEIYSHLDRAHIILLLVSQNYLKDNFQFQIELTRAMQRYEDGEARVIPIILSPCDWQQTPFGKLLALPKHGKPVAEWTNREAAFADIVENIYVVAEELRTQHLLTAKALLTFETVNQMSQTEKEEELDRIERQLESSFESRVTRAVKKALRDSPQSKRNTAISTISLCCILILLFEMTVYYWLPSQLHWLIVHPNSFGIQLTIDTFVVLAIVGYMYPGKVRIWCWGAGIFAIFGIFLQIIGGPH